MPNTGDLSGSWGTAAVNPNWTAVDGILGGVVSLSITGGSTTLTVPSAGSASPGAGPTQSQNALIRFSGTLTGNATVVFTLPGFYIVENLCAGNATCYIQLVPSGGGNNIGAPPGQKQHVFYDGTNMDYIDMPPVGTYLDMCVSTTPLWITACTVQPWLPCTGVSYSSGTYANLFNLIGGTFGSNTPDLQSRSRLSLDVTGVNRVTSAGSGINGASLAASGGSQFLQAHSHVIPFGATSSPGAGGTVDALVKLTITTSTFTTGAGSSQNMPPAIVAGVTFIKT